MTVEQIMGFTQLAITLCAMWALLCRMAAMTKATDPMVRRQHATLFGGMELSVLLPLSPEMPQGIGIVCLSASVLAFLLFSLPRWRHGAPQETETGPIPLDLVGWQPVRDSMGDVT